MKKTATGRILYAAVLVAASVSPALALDYEAKPVNACLQAPVKLTGAVTGALISGCVCGPVDKSYHWFLKGTKHIAGKFGNEKGAAQIAFGVPIGGAPGAVLGAAYGVPYGLAQGFKEGWNKPFSRWSYTTLPEEK